ncbi:MAG: hypothetical protein ACFE9D_00995 [Promethearchaeota archaeon]
MGRRYKIIQCPHCSEFTYIPIGVWRNTCPRCNEKVALHELQGVIVPNLQEAQIRVQQRQYVLHGLVTPTLHLRPVQQVLKILRSHRTDCPQWFPIHEIYQQCIEAGLLPKEVQEAIDVLKAEGFLEKREDTIRAVPLN